MRFNFTLDLWYAMISGSIAQYVLHLTTNRHTSFNPLADWKNFGVNVHPCSLSMSQISHYVLTKVKWSYAKQTTTISRLPEELGGLPEELGCNWLFTKPRTWGWCTFLYSMSWIRIKMNVSISYKHSMYNSMCVYFMVLLSGMAIAIEAITRTSQEQVNRLSRKQIANQLCAWSCTFPGIIIAITCIIIIKCLIIS